MRLASPISHQVWRGHLTTGLVSAAATRNFPRALPLGGEVVTVGDEREKQVA
jgi:hypothetical protein